MLSRQTIAIDSPAERCGMVATLQRRCHDVSTGLSRYSEHNGPQYCSFSYEFGSTFLAAR
jgi:hypothetical protein